MKTLFVKGGLPGLFLLILFSLNANAQPNYVYTNNNIDVFSGRENSVTAFSVAANGTLTEIPGSPFLTGGGGSLGDVFFASVGIDVTVVGSFLYVTNSASGDISGFTINPATGALTAVPGSPFPTGGLSLDIGISLAVAPDNRFLFAANGDSTDISIFSIAANGSLTPIAGSPFPLVSTPAGVKVSPDGRFLAIAFINIDAVGVYSINANGTLTAAPGSPFPSPAAGQVSGLDINCAGTLLYGGQAAPSGTHVDGFSIAPNGSLTPIPGSPFDNSDANNSNKVLLSKDERFLFVSNQFSTSVTVFNVAANGSLSSVPGSPFQSGSIFSAGMATNQAGNLLYIANFPTGSVSVLSIAANGTLAQVPGSPFFTGQGSGVTSLAAFPPKSCSQFDFCIQDDVNGNLLRFNSNTGAYTFLNCRKGITLTGKGTVVKKVSNGFCKIELTDRGPDPKRPDRNVSASVNPCTGKGNAQVTFTTQAVTISDSNIYNNACLCQ